MPETVFVKPDPSADEWSVAAGSGGIADTADVVAKAAATGRRHYVTGAQMINTDATVGTEVVIKSAATVIWRGFAPASIAAVTQPSMVDIKFNPPLRTVAGEALNVACITNSSQTYVNLQGYTAK